MIQGLPHITFIVRDLDRMTRIVEGVFEATEAHASDDDNHLFELHTGTLSERLARYARKERDDVR